MSRTIICYDLDGTLIDSASSIYESLKFACGKEFVEPPRFNKLKFMLGSPLNEYIQNLLDIDSYKSKKIIQNFRNHHDNGGYLNYKLYDHVTEVLNFFKLNKIKQYIITNKPIEITLKAISYLGIKNYFESVYSTSNDEKPKKDKSFFMNEIKTNCNILYYVGDTENDKKETEKSKSIFIFANYGYGKLKNPILQISSPRELIKQIKL